MKFLLILLFPVTLMASTQFKAYEGVFNNSTITSQPMRIINYESVSIQTVYTGTLLAGSCLMQMSNDKENWASIDSSEAFFTSEGGNDFINYTGSGAVWMRASCTSTTTSDVTMKIYLGGKE